MNGLVRFAVSSVLFGCTGAALAAEAREVPSVSPSGAAIAPQPLDGALTMLSKQAGLQIIYATELAQGRSSLGSPTGLSAEQMLQRVLDGTGLTYKWLDARTVIVRTVEEMTVAGESAATKEGGAKSLENESNLSVEENGNPGTQLPVQLNQESDSAEKLQQVVVTGTHVRGVTPGSSPMTVISQEDIQRSGYASTRELLNKLPQNFPGGLSEAFGSTNPTSGANVGPSSSIDLRGLGSGATLVLLNGHRIAAPGLGTAPDLSAIPLAALDRIDVLTDGASAVYGSDAVGGVVNFILKKRADGFETSAQWGDATRGGMDELKVSQFAGLTWESGGIQGIYEHYEQDALSAQERNFSNDTSGILYLLPKQRRNSFIISAEQEAGERLLLSSDVLYSRQEKIAANGPAISNVGGPNVLSANARADLKLSDAWTFSVDGLFGESNLDERTFSSSTGAVLRPSTPWRSQLKSTELQLTGSLLQLPAGPLSVAIGVGKRWEEVESTVQKSDGPAKRDNTSAYGELIIPLVSSVNSRPGFRALELTLAGRHEDYSLSGSHSDPKIGLSWSPLAGAKLRGTWSTAFRVPRLYDTSGDLFAVVVPIPDPLAPGNTLTVLSTAGANPNLRPETSESWTLGLDYSSASMPSIQISTTYYNTRFKDRIQSLAGGFGAYILQAANLPAGTVVENPSPDFVSETIASVGPAQRFIFADPADVSTYIVISPQNIARVKTSGVDFALNYSLETEKGHLGTTFSATRILKFEEQSLASLPIIDRVNTVFYPPKMRLRAGANWSSGPLDTSFFINYVGAYRNNFVVPSESVSNYTTIDSQMKVDLESIWSGTEFSIIARNLFDKDPPYVSSANFDLGSELGYDPANADPIGRLISVQLTKRW